MVNLYTLKNGTIVIVERRYGQTVVLSGDDLVYGEPQNSELQLEVSRSFGYGDDTRAMVADHDPMHALLTDWLGMPTSVSLFGGDPEIAKAEETAVLAVQKLMRLAGGKMPFPK